MPWSRNRRRLVYAAYCVLLLFVALAVVELALRARGHRPWAPPTDANIVIEPGGRLFRRDAELGFVPLRGRFRVALDPAFSFTMTHAKDGLRITRPLRDYRLPRTRPEIWVFGCSVTYGWGLDDRETYPWLLQERLPEFDVSNFGVPAYGNVQSLIQFRQALKAGRKPVLAILGYASFHDMRNAFLRDWRKLIAPLDKLHVGTWPYARLSSTGALDYAIGEMSYTEFPLMRRLAVVSLLETQLNALEAAYLRANEVSVAVIMSLFELCKQNDVELLIAGLSADPVTQETLRTLASKGIHAVDLGIDFNDPARINAPYDIHPNAKTSAQFAPGFETAVRNLRLPKPDAEPAVEAHPESGASKGP